jgi:hypothetical protein
MPKRIAVTGVITMIGESADERRPSLSPRSHRCAVRPPRPVFHEEPR